MAGVEPHEGWGVLPPLLDGRAAADAIGTGATVLDVREAATFAHGHLPGSLCVPRGGSFPTWAGTVLRPEHRVVLVAGSVEDVVDTVDDLARIGLPTPLGWVPSASLEAVPGVGPGGLRRLEGRDFEFARRAATRGELTLVDVRNPLESLAQPMRGAVELPAGRAIADTGLVPAGPVVVACASNLRATIVASVLLAEGRREVYHVPGGVGAAAHSAPVRRLAPIDRSLPAT
jgi:hydroxyacylglutathione hydrolase